MFHCNIATYKEN